MHTQYAFYEATIKKTHQYVNCDDHVKGMNDDFHVFDVTVMKLIEW